MAKAHHSFGLSNTRRRGDKCLQIGRYMVLTVSDIHNTVLPSVLHVTFGYLERISVSCFDWMEGGAMPASMFNDTASDSQ